MSALQERSAPTSVQQPGYRASLSRIAAARLGKRHDLAAERAHGACETPLGLVEVDGDLSILIYRRDQVRLACAGSSGGNHLMDGHASDWSADLVANLVAALSGRVACDTLSVREVHLVTVALAIGAPTAALEARVRAACADGLGLDELEAVAHLAVHAHAWPDGFEALSRIRAVYAEAGT